MSCDKPACESFIESGICKCFNSYLNILLRHARKYFTGEESQLTDVQRVMGLLAFSPETQIPVYKVSVFICANF